MKHIPEINHCIPNRRAYWCGKCKCHSQFTIRSSGSGNNKSLNYICLHCGSRQFYPQAVIPWMYGLLGFAFVTIVVVPVCCPLFAFLDEFVERNGIPCSISFGVFFGLIGFMMRTSLKKWDAWRAEQRWKSPSELEAEALEHPHQPVYGDSETYFNEWAAQFLSPGQLDRLHEEHGSAKTGEELKADGN